MILTDLEALINDRKINPVEGSYTNRLLNDPQKTAQKVGEEAVETIIAALGQSDEQLIEESADMLYHWLVLLSTRNISLDRIFSKLEERRK